MKYNLSGIEERVMALLDENREIITERCEFMDPGVSLTGLIRMLLPDAARISLCSLPLSQIGECCHLESDVTVTHISGEKARFELPHDFLRLVNLRMDHWDYGVSTPLAFDTDSYRLRVSSGSRGRERHTRPAAAVLQFGERKVMNVFGTLPGSRIVEFDYLAVPEIDDDMIDLPLGTFTDVCERLAEMIRLILSRGTNEID